MILQVGGFEFGEISIKSSPNSSAFEIACGTDKTPKTWPSGPITRTSCAKISRFTRYPSPFFPPVRPPRGRVPGLVDLIGFMSFSLLG